MYQPQKLPDHLQKAQAKQSTKNASNPQKQPIHQAKSGKSEENQETTNATTTNDNPISSRESGQKSQSNSILPLALAFLLMKE